MPYLGAHRPMRLLTRSSAVVVLIAVAALLAQGACVPHTHSGVGVGLYNEEHDLTLMSASSVVGPLPVTPLVFISVVTAPLALSAPPAPSAVVNRDAESRAPPAA